MPTKVKALAAALNAWLDARDRILRGDARLYSKGEWRERGELYGRDADLTLVIDGSPLYAALNHGEPSWIYHTQLTDLARQHGYFWELGFAWSVHFYPL